LCEHSLPAKPHGNAAAVLAFVIDEFLAMQLAKIAWFHLTTLAAHQLLRLERFVIVLRV
jgi:hypothetical protein